jgi:hypothetical protein
MTSPVSNRSKLFAKGFGRAAAPPIFAELLSIPTLSFQKKLHVASYYMFLNFSFVFSLNPSYP